MYLDKRKQWNDTAQTSTHLIPLDYTSNRWIELERDCVQCHVDFYILVAYLDGCTAQWTLLRVLDQEFEDTELAETMTTLKTDRLDELAQANTASNIVV